jgi:hypothetical protein
MMDKGFYKKYNVFKDGIEINEKTFTLLFESDPIAKIALKAYADATSNEVLKKDLYKELEANGRL